jgi:hypothetical protein
MRVQQGRTLAAECITPPVCYVHALNECDLLEAANVGPDASQQSYTTVGELVHEVNQATN